jgi:hypothetical protein
MASVPYFSFKFDKYVVVLGYLLIFNNTTRRKDNFCGLLEVFVGATWILLFTCLSVIVIVLNNKHIKRMFTNWRNPFFLTFQKGDNKV